MAASLLLLASGCSSGSTAPSPSPSASRSSLQPPNPVVESLFDGTAHLDLTGDVEQAYDFDLLSASNEEDMSIMAWGRGLNSFDVLAGRASLVEGKHKSSHSLWISVVLQSIDASFVSDGGECTITLTRVQQGALRGRVTCPQLTSENHRRTVRLEGTFSAGPGGA